MEAEETIEKMQARVVKRRSLTKEECESTKIVVVVPRYLKKEIKEFARSQNESVSQFIRKIVIDYMDEGFLTHKDLKPEIIP